jgi:ATP-dependent DNA helicase RecG
MKQLVFISSVQKELADERRAVRDFITGDALLRRFFDIFLFEDLPASDRRADDVYLAEVDRCGIYLALLGQEYGMEDAEGKSPTEREFDQATKKRKVRLVFVKGSDDKGRHPKMQSLIRKAGAQLIRRRFTDIPDLTTAVYSSLVDHLERAGRLRTLPFDAAAALRSSVGDISTGKLNWLLDTAHRERDYPLSAKTPALTALTHLKLLDGGKPNHAAVLLVGKDPQRFIPTAEVKCLHFHGTEISKPIPSYQVYKGTVFDQVDQAVDFVMSKLARSVGTRAKGPQAPVQYEIPQEVIAEAIVNAIAHRDYTSKAGVQVMLFADRLEVWNSGELPPMLTPESLREAHPSIPHNPLIAEPLYLTRYIEKAGTGTLDMIARCREAGLPEPDFEQRGGQFVVTVWRDWLTDTLMAEIDLNERQKKAVTRVKIVGRISNLDYQEIAETTKKTASRDLDDLVIKGVFAKIGTTGRGTHYVLSRKGDKKGTKGTSADRSIKGDKKGTKGT